MTLYKVVFFLAFMLQLMLNYYKLPQQNAIRAD